MDPGCGHQVGCGRAEGCRRGIPDGLRMAHSRDEALWCLGGEPWVKFRKGCWYQNLQRLIKEFGLNSESSGSLCQFLRRKVKLT